MIEGPVLVESYKASDVMIKKTKSKNTKVILLIPSTDQRVDYADRDNELKKHTDQIIKLAIESQIGLVDFCQTFEYLYTRKKKLRKYMSQVNHPNKKGHELIANEILSGLNDRK